VVDRTALEMRHRCKPIGGSNPSLSAMTFTAERFGRRISKRMGLLFVRLGLHPTASKALCGMIALMVAGSTSIALANPLTPFRYEWQAQRHCPADAVVWLDFRKRIYYSKRQRHYARGFDGSFICREEARRSGFRASLLGLR
jgi:hypothetical protein